MAAQDPEMADMTRSDARDAALANLPPESREKAAEARSVLAQDIALKVNQAVSSEVPLMERLGHFWADHFSVSVGKLGTQVAVGDHEFTAIRRMCWVGSRDLLQAATLHPAMLLYLDQFESVGPIHPPKNGAQRARTSSPVARARAGQRKPRARNSRTPHARRCTAAILKPDVTEFARALTGLLWRRDGRAERFGKDQPSGAKFVAVAHEPGTRGLCWAGPIRQAQRIRRWQFCAIWRCILRPQSSSPPSWRAISPVTPRRPTLIARLEADFLRTGGDLASLTRTLIEAPEAWAPAPVKFRTPFEWLVASLRLTGAESLPRDGSSLR